MLLISLEDFYEKAAACRRLTRAEEIACYDAMVRGDREARVRLIESYTPFVAAHLRRSKFQSLGLAVYCMAALEKAVDSFDFSQNSETFAHRLSWALRQATTAYIVRHP